MGRWFRLDGWGGRGEGHNQNRRRPVCFGPGCFLAETHVLGVSWRRPRAFVAKCHRLGYGPKL